MAKLVPLEEFDRKRTSEPTPGRLVPIEEFDQQRGAMRATADTGLGVAQGGLNIVSGGMRLVDLAARFNPGGPAGLVFYRSLLNNGGDVGAALKQTKDVILAPESALSYSAGNIDRSTGMLQTLKSEPLQRAAQESNERIEQQSDERDAEYLASLPADDRAALEAARAGGPLDAAGTYIRRPGLALGALKGVAAEAKDQAVELVQNPSLAADFAAQQVPQFLATGGAVKLATRGLAGEAATKAGQRAALTAGTGLESGGAAGQAAQQFEQMPDEKLLTLPRTKELLDQGLTLDEIRGLYGRQAGAVAAPLAGLSSGGFNKLTGASKLESSIFGAGEEPARRTLGQTARRGLAATGIEGAQGGAEEGASQLATNVGASTVDPEQSLSEGVGSNIALGALMEGPMGGAGRVVRDVADNIQAKRSDAAGEFEAAAKRFSTAQDPDSGADVLVTPSGVALGSPDEAQAAWQKASPEERATWMQPLESPPPSGDSAVGHPEDAEIERVRAYRDQMSESGRGLVDRRIALLTKQRDGRIKAERAKAVAEKLRDDAQIAADAGDFDSRRELLKEADRLAPPTTQVDGIEVGEAPAEVTLADPDVDPRRPPTAAGIEVGTLPEITLKDGRPAPDEELPSTEGIEVTTPEVDAAQPAPVAGEEPSPVEELRRLSAKTDDPDVQAVLAAEIRAQEKRAKAQTAAQQKSAAQARAAEGLKKLAMSTENEGVRSLLLARAEKLQAPASEPDPFAPSLAAAASPTSAKAPRTSADMAERSRKALLAEIRQMGGIDQREMPDIAGEGRRNAAGGVATRAGGQVRNLFTKNGVGLDRVRERMAEMGYFTDDGDVTGDLGTVREVVRAALDGDGVATLTPGERGDYEAMRIAEKTAADEVAAELELSQTERERALLQHQADELLTDDERSTLAERYQDDDEYFQRLQEAVNAKRESDEDREGRQADPAAGGREDGGAPRVEAAARVEDAAEKLEGYVTPRPEPGSGLSQRNPEASKVSNFRLSLPPTQAMPRDQVEATVASILKRWKNAPPVTVVDSMTSSEVPAEVRRDYVQQVKNGARGAPRAFYHRKKAYLVADQLNSPRAATEALFHEVLGHYGLRETFGQELRPVLEAVAKYRKADVDAKVKSYGFDPTSATDRLRAAEEVLAELAQTRPQLIIVRRAFAIIRSFLRKLGLNFNYSDDELIQNFILPARRFVERGATRKPAEARLPGAGAQPAYSLNDGWIEKANRRMAKLVDEWLAGKVRPGDAVLLGDTPPVLRALGAPNLQMEILGEVLHKTQDGKHKDFGLTPGLLKDLPQHLYDPAAVFESDGKPGMVLATDMQDQFGNPVVAIVHIGRGNSRAVINRIASVYSKQDAEKVFSGWAEKGLLRYVRNDEGPALSTSVPLYLGKVVQSARSLGKKYKTAADVPQLRQKERSELQLLGEARQQENPEERSPAIGERSGLQLPRVVRQLRGDGDKVLAEADLVKDGVAPANANSRTDPADTEGPAAEMAPPDGDDRTAFSLALPRRLSREDDPFVSENARIRESNRSVWDRAKQVVVRQLKPGGALHGGVFDANQVREANIRGVGIEAQYRIHDLERAVKSDYGKPVSELPLRDLSALHEALTGTVNNLPAATKVAMVAMRQYLDTQSREYVAILQDQARRRLEADPDVQNDTGLIDTITKNMGHWVHRSYRAFDDPKWHQKVSPQTLNAARLHLRGEYRQAGLSEREANERAESTINGILKTGTAYGDMGSFITQSKLGAKDLGVLMKRKSIHPVIRGLLGEYVDPRINFAKSTAKMGALIANSRFLDSVRDMGLGNFLFEKDERPVEATVQLAGKQSATYAPLNGLWVTPETAQAFEDALGDQSPEGWYRWAVAANAWVNYGKTVLSPTTAMRNLTSSFFFTLANGHFNLAKAKEAWRLVRSRFGEDRAAAQRYVEKLARLGIVGDGAHEGDFRQYLESSGISRWFDGDSAVGRLNDAMQGFYRFGDDFWKIIGFENEKAALARAGMSEAEAETEAAERVRNTYPTYSLAPKAIKAVARSPIIGSFATFSAEIIRTSYHLLRYARKDLRSDNPAMRANGLRRALGFAAVNGLFFALWALSKGAAGVDDDEDEAVRSLAPPWQKNSMFWYSGRDKDGNLQYFDLTFLNPYGMFSRPVVAALRDQPWEEQFKSAAADLLGPFVGPDIAISGLAEIAFNKKLSSGGPVYRQGEAAEGIAEHLWDTLKPGAAGNVERWYNALTDTRKRTGEEYKESDELAALFGWRMTTMQPKAALYYRAMEFSDDKRAATAYLKKRLTDPNKVSAADIRRARATAEELHERAFRDMGRVVLAARESGLSPDQVWNVLRARGISQRDARALLIGELPPFQLSDQFLRSARRNAIALGLDELSEDLPSRYAEVED